MLPGHEGYLSWGAGPCVLRQVSGALQAAEPLMEDLHKDPAGSVVLHGDLPLPFPRASSPPRTAAPSSHGSTSASLRGLPGQRWAPGLPARGAPAH